MTAVELLESLNLLDENERIEVKRTTILAGIDNATYRELNKINALVASGALCRPRDAGLPTQEVLGAETYDVPTGRLEAKEDGLPSKSVALPTNPEALSDNPEDWPTNPSPEEETARRALLAELPGDLAAWGSAQGCRSTPEEAKVVVIEVCRLRAWRAEELALLLHHNSLHVRNTYLRLLMRDGRLVMTNPDEPNDPQQAYRTVEAIS
nr:hypothetical protein [uncultured Pseudogulbenkiania sp.]